LSAAATLLDKNIRPITVVATRFSSLDIGMPSFFKVVRIIIAQRLEHCQDLVILTDFYGKTGLSQE
jgi:hypothetical protein